MTSCSPFFPPSGGQVGHLSKGEVVAVIAADGAPARGRGGSAAPF